MGCRIFIFLSNDDNNKTEAAVQIHRASYIYGICKRNSALIMPNYDMLLAIPGIGKKVASCIMEYMELHLSI